MLDTVKLKSPHLSDVEAARIERSCQRRMAVEMATGELLYEITTGSLVGSFDSRVSVRVEREDWLEPGLDVPASASCVIIEGSVHKALLGHNVFGGPNEPQAACRWFVHDLSRRLGCALPEGQLWTVLRLDWAEVYDLASYEAVEEYVHGLNAASYPRRKLNRYGDEALHCPGDTTTLKAYHKGPEFSRHDHKRLKHCLEPGRLLDLQLRANQLLRWEVSIKSTKLNRDFGHKPSVVEVTRSYLEAVHDREVARLLREGLTEMETVRTHKEVADRLREVYPERLANVLFGTWLQLSALGEDYLKTRLRRSTFYLHRKQLQEAGVSWHGADVCIAPSSSLVPKGFTPTRNSPYRLTEEASEVRMLLASFAA